MPKRSAVSLPDIASIDTLSLAFHQAARGKHQRPDVQAFAAHLDRALAALSRDILEGRSPDGNWTSFQIYDPKPRQILAPCFRDRVLHHALMLHVAPVLETALVDDTFACRPGKGTLAAVLRAQQHIRRFPWFVKTDVRAYFASIDHSVLMRLLRRRLKHPGVLALCERIVQRTPCGSEKGLPIGALTSQHFANTYLDGLDRFLLEQQQVRGLARYMDDIVWWVDGRRRAVETLDAAREYLATERHLEIKPTAQIGRSEQGLPFLGFWVLLGSLRLSLRRKRRYRAARLRWEQEYADGKIDESGLQAGYAAALGITAHADASAWRRAEMEQHPPPEV